MKILLLSVQFKTTKKRVLNWKKKFSQKLIFLNFNILKVQNITYVNGKCQKSWSKLSACLYILIYMCKRMREKEIDKIYVEEYLHKYIIAER